jgi:DNA repair exonuclease SbcCD ATPase subunit
MTHDDPNLLSNDDDFLVQLGQVETAIAALKYRYRDLNNALQQREKLTQQQAEIEKEQETHPRVELEQQLQEIQRQIQELSIELESRLLNDGELQKILRQLYWQALKQGVLQEWFWQIVRFGGLGVIIGWLLKSCQS